MKLYSFLSLAAISLQTVYAAEYSVIAFPNAEQTVNVVVQGQSHALTQEPDHPNIFKGTAPSAENYQYALISNAGQQVLEAKPRILQQGVESTGVEFFNRSQTVYNVPGLPQAYHPIYPPLFSNMNRSDEIATIILEANATGLNEILANPLGDFDYTLVSKMTYISNKELFTFSNAGIKNSGASSKEFGKQSFKIKLNEFVTQGDKELLYGRTTVKLRAHETDPTFVREKLYLDCLAAAGAATLSGSWARLYINNEPYGLFLMIDDSTTSTIDNLLHGGNHQYEFTGPTYKGNALNPQVEGNLVYQGDNPESYNDTMYELEDKGANGKLINKTNEKEALIGFIRQLSTIDPKLITDEANQGEFPKLLDPKHTMIHLALNFLSGSWDGVWLQASNYYLNQDLQSNQWALISYDFDETFGIGAEKHLISTPYTNYSRPGSQRPLIDVFLNSPYYKAEFEKVLQTIVKRFFKASVINPRLEAWTQMLREEVEWDLSITPKSPGIQTQWTLWNFEANMNTTDGLNFGVAEWFNTRSTSLQQQLNFNDADDLPALGPYEGGSQWDPSNYHKKTVNDKKSNDDSQSSDSSSNAISKSTISTAVLLFSTVSLMFLL